MPSALLLTEPEEATRSFLERHLIQDGFEVVEAETGGKKNGPRSSRDQEPE